MYFRGLRKSIETRYIIAAQEPEKLYFYLCCYQHSNRGLIVLLLPAAVPHHYFSGSEVEGRDSLRCCSSPPRWFFQDNLALGLVGA